MCLFEKKILVGHSEDAILAITEHLEKSNIPFELGIKDVLKRSSEEYEAFYRIKVQKECAKQADAIVSQYVSQKDLKNWYKVAKKKSRKLESKENALFWFVVFIYFLAVAAIEIGKVEGAVIPPSIGGAVLLIGGIFMVVKFYKKMKKESGILRESNKSMMIVGITVIIYAVASFIYVFRLVS